MAITINLNPMTEEYFTLNMMTALRTNSAYTNGDDATKTAMVQAIISTNNAEWNDFESKFTNWIQDVISAIKIELGIGDKTDAQRTLGFIDRMGKIASAIYLVFLPPV